MVPLRLRVWCALWALLVVPLRHRVWCTDGHLVLCQSVIVCVEHIGRFWRCRSFIRGDVLFARSVRCHPVFGCGVQLGFQCSASSSPGVMCTLGANGGDAPSLGRCAFRALSVAPLRLRVRCTLRALIEVPLRYRVWCTVGLSVQCQSVTACDVHIGSLWRCRSVFRGEVLFELPVFPSRPRQPVIPFSR